MPIQLYRSPFSLWPFFLISLFFTVYSSSFMATYTLLPFSPFLTIAINRLSFSKSLWVSMSCGLLIDLLSSKTPFGFHALNQTLTTSTLYRFRPYFVEKALALSSFSLLFSFVSTFFHRIFLYLFGISFPLTWKGCSTDFILMPLLDGLYAFLWFFCPLILYHLLHRQWFRFLFFRKETKKKSEETPG